MEVVFRLNENDILAGLRLIQKRAPLTKRFNYIGVIIVTLFPCINFFVRQQFTLFYVVNLLVEIALMALLYVLLSKILKPVLRRQVVAALKKKDGGVLGEHKICITEDILTESTSVNEHRQKWAGIMGVYQNESYIIIMIGNQQGHIIPKRAFVDDDAASQFYNQANEFYQNSQQV